MTLFESLYGRRYRSLIGWFKVGDVALIEPELVHEVMEKFQLIMDRLEMTQSRQKSSANVRRRELKFAVNDWIYTKISP
ncbi:hypothetical protein MTR67_048741 [Solanum verrucosum]|uniref:Uncharacterized protein n=1 Tax=Solanum verrucosum TaxID=315347 RepID=A0AAF0V1Z4_SOLVR|nr:hypothetical protein MTR67_048741 [Solanum verrucosum]